MTSVDAAVIDTLVAIISVLPSAFVPISLLCESAACCAALKTGTLSYEVGPVAPLTYPVLLEYLIV